MLVVAQKSYPSLQEPVYLFTRRNGVYLETCILTAMAAAIPTGLLKKLEVMAGSSSKTFGAACKLA